MTGIRRLFLFCWLMLLLPIVATAGDSVMTTCPEAKLEVERLADLNIPRAGHELFCVNGEMVVAGGHTDGFVPTPTAEYYQGGEWHTIPMTYNHDFGFSVVLKSGRVLLAGGCEQPTGIGQTFVAELYNPETHTFRGFGNMQQKRVWASALEVDSGQVVIAGNWYEKDGIELFYEHESHSGDFKGKNSFTYIKEVAAERAMPYLFRTAEHDALIIGSLSSRGDTLHSTLADRLSGDTVHIPLFETWQPLMPTMHHDETSMIGDEAKGDFTYLLPVQDSTGQVSIARVCGTDIQLLPTACAVPKGYQGDEIEYLSNVIVDRHARRAYLMGISSIYHTVNDKTRLYVLSIDYAKASEPDGAPMTLYFTDPLNITPSCAPLLTPEGNLLIAGGMAGNSNYNPSAAVFLLRLGTASNSSGINWLLWIGLAAVGLILLAAVLLTVRGSHGDRLPEATAQEPVSMTNPADDILMQRINRLMEEQKLYLNSDLKLADVATALGTNRNAISNCINSQTGGSFTQFVNVYRIEYAKELMRNQPDIKISEVWTVSGFTTESSFFRTFKTIVGMPPSEWKQKKTDETSSVSKN